MVVAAAGAANARAGEATSTGGDITMETVEECGAKGGGEEDIPAAAAVFVPVIDVAEFNDAEPSIVGD